MLSIARAAPTRPDPYTPVHKMQRARLFDLVVVAGTIDPDDPAARSGLAGAVAMVVHELTHHGHHEEQFVHPLLRRHAPDIATELERGHDLLHAELLELAGHAAGYAAAAPIEPNGLHRSLSAFTGTYLAHLDVEETAALPALHAACTDAELVEVFAAFRASRSEVTNLASTLAQMPTLNPGERERMLTTGLGSTPAQDVADLLATLLRAGQRAVSSGAAQPASS